MFRAEEIPPLRQAVEEEVIRPQLRGSGIGATLFGVISLFGGVMPPRDPILIVLGAVLSFVGLWNLVMVTATGILMSAISLAMVGVYNVVGTLLAASGGGGSPGPWPVIGVFQILWAFQRFEMWKRFRNALTADVPAPLRERARTMIAELRRLDPKRNADVVMMRTGTATPTLLKVRLTPEGALALALNRSDVALAARSEVVFEATKTGDKQTRGLLRIGERRWSGVMPNEHVARLNAWLGSRSAQRFAA